MPARMLTAWTYKHNRKAMYPCLGFAALDNGDKAIKMDLEDLAIVLENKIESTFFLVQPLFKV